MNNFKIINPTALYFSKYGVDTYIGTANSPKASLVDTTIDNIIGSGLYKGVFNYNTDVTRNLYGDGITIIEFTDDSTYLKTTATMSLYDIEFRLKDKSLITATNTGNVIFNDCKVLSGSINGKLDANRSIFYEIELLTTLNCIFAQNSIIKSVFTMACNSMTSTYVSEDTTITWSDLNTSTFIGNNFRGKVIYAGNTYELKKDRLKNIIVDRVGNGILDVEVIVSNVYDTNFSQDALFTYPERLDFLTVADTSPNILSGFTDLNIGNIRYATTNFLNDLESIDSITKGNTCYYVNKEASEGFLITKPILLAPFPMILDTFNLNALFNFNSDIDINSFENNNVVSKNTFDSGAGSLPNRLTYEMRWTSSYLEPTDFDNDGDTALNEYVIFEQDRVPEIDISGLGNGEPLFNNLNKKRIRGNWIQVKLTINKGLN